MSLAVGFAGQAKQPVRVLAHGHGERWVARPGGNRGQQLAVPGGVERCHQLVVVVQLLGEQTLLDVRDDRTQHQIRRQGPDRGGEPCPLHLRVTDLPEQLGVPGQLAVQTLGCGRVEQLTEHPQCAPQTTRRDAGGVHRVESQAQ